MNRSVVNSIMRLAGLFWSVQARAVSERLSKSDRPIEGGEVALLSLEMGETCRKDVNCDPPSGGYEESFRGGC